MPAEPVLYFQLSVPHSVSADW